MRKKIWKWLQKYDVWIDVAIIVACLLSALLIIVGPV